MHRSNFLRRIFGVVALLVATVPIAGASSVAAPVLSLPRPTGVYPVGATTLHLTDATRPDPWRPEVRRELMVTLWYPARDSAGPLMPYTTAGVSAKIVAAEGLPLPPDVLTTVRTNARRDVPVRAPVGRGWPLVVLSPGFSLSRESLTGLAEDLASRGYVVAGVDHPYEARGVEFPDGRVAGCLACDLTGVMPKVVQGRTADISFLLDRLSRARFVDRTRIAAVGHSIGGASAALLLLTDRRVDVAADLDGSLFVPLPAGRVTRPVLLLASDRSADPTWLRDWPGLAGWKRWLTVAGSGHMSFTDRPVLGAQLGLDPGPIPAERQLLITREYVSAFLDLHLRHHPGAFPAFPEVTRTR